jgi:hypothetical protein
MGLKADKNSTTAREFNDRQCSHKMGTASSSGREVFPHLGLKAKQKLNQGKRIQ